MTSITPRQELEETKCLMNEALEENNLRSTYSIYNRIYTIPETRSISDEHIIAIFKSKSFNRFEPVLLEERDSDHNALVEIRYSNSVSDYEVYLMNRLFKLEQALAEANAPRQ